MAFTSFNPTQGPINEIFMKKCWKLGELKMADFLSQPFWIFIFKKKIFFASSQWKLVHIYRIARIFWNFDDYDGLQPKLSAPKHISRQCRMYIYKRPFINYIRTCLFLKIQIPKSKGKKVFSRRNFTLCNVEKIS